VEAPRATCRERFVAVIAVAALAAAVDTLLVRAEHHHRPLDVALYAESFALWLAFALLALIPASLFDRWIVSAASAARHPVRAAARLAAWTILPVVLHARLDAYTGLNARLGELASAKPWLDAAGAAAIVLLAVAVFGRVLQRLQPRTVAFLAIASSTLCGAFVSFHTDERPSDPRAPSDAKPNVLCLVWDTARAESLSFLGAGRETTPNLARLASESLVFTHARSVSTYTLTSHISMLTGVFPSHHGARMTRQRFQPLQTPTVVRAFREAGYRTGGFVGNDVLRAQSGIAFAFETYDDRVDPWVTYTHGWALVHDLQAAGAKLVPALWQNGLPHWIQDYQRPASEVLEHAREWIESDDPRPWFCFVNLYDVHWPYLPESAAREKWVEPYDGIVDGYSKRGNRVHASRYELVERDDEHLAELYDAELWELDRAVEQFLAALDLSRTSLIVTADHGEAFGEGGEYEHADVLECQTRVPLIVRPAGGVAARRVEAPVSGVDVAPTLLAFAGLPPPPESRGVNLLGELDPQREILVEHRDQPNPAAVKLALYDGAWKLVRLGAAEPHEWRLYDSASDPNEAQDVAAAHPEIVERLRKRMNELRATWRADDRADMAGTEVGNADALKALGYADVERPKSP
jgi:arylsulfatase